jgi:hypothetical protein
MRKLFVFLINLLTPIRFIGNLIAGLCSGKYNAMVEYSWPGSKWDFSMSTGIRNIPIGVYLDISWPRYDFNYPDDKGFYPRGHKAGAAKFRIYFAAFYWSVALFIYQPKKIDLTTVV